MSSNNAIPEKTPILACFRGFLYVCDPLLIHFTTLFITSKVAAEHKDYESVKVSIDETLEKMGLDYLMLVK